MRGETLLLEQPPEHAWFEERGPVCTLLVYVDDAITKRAWATSPLIWPSRTTAREARLCLSGLDMRPWWLYHMTMTQSKAIPAGEFKARCLSLLDRVATTGEPLVVTKRGKPVAKVVPIEARSVSDLKGSVTFHGDIVGPVLDAWEMDQ